MSHGLELHEEELDSLSMRQKLLLASACAQRHIAAYNAYVACSRSRKSPAFEQILDPIWGDIPLLELDGKTLDQMQVYAERLVPSERLRRYAYSAHAEMAALALIHCIQVRIDGDSEDVVRAAKQGFDSIWQYLVKPGADGARRQIDIAAADAVSRFDVHALTQAEHARQENDLHAVKRVSAEDASLKEVLGGLRQQAKTDADLLIPIFLPRKQSSVKSRP
jgi:uncharacterized protein YjaG (DUF416 family)